MRLALPFWQCDGVVVTVRHVGWALSADSPGAEAGTSTIQPGGKPSADAIGPTVLRMMVGSKLHRLREAAGVTPDQAGYEIRSSRSKISRMENGHVSFKERDVADLLSLYGITDEQVRAGILSLARQANAPGWWSKYGDVLADWFEAYLGLEAAVSVIRSFELQFVHGLFQTEAYARAVTQLGYKAAPAEEIERRVSLRGQAPGTARAPGAAAGMVGHRRGGAAAPGGQPRGDARADEAAHRGRRHAPCHRSGCAIRPRRARGRRRVIQHLALRRS
jgi:hypothetical protein